MFIKDEHLEYCPVGGLFFSEKCKKPLLTVGCDSPSRMNLTELCSVKFPDEPTEVAITESLVCRTSFRIKNETFLIASSRRRFLCMKFWLKNHDRLVVDTYSDMACYPDALRLSKRLPERYEIVRTAGCPSRATELIRFFLKPNSGSRPLVSNCFLFFFALKLLSLL
uniref:Uncharacterized protein n=1 Tax=Panagrolaimus sp. JU765 TaxID=591449 RepID=A0AC34RJX9_9BILA